nr:DUF459 domain-containing protein [Caulobacter sp. 17J65-9]
MDREAGEESGAFGPVARWLGRRSSIFYLGLVAGALIGLVVTPEGRAGAGSRIASFFAHLPTSGGSAQAAEPAPKRAAAAAPAPAVVPVVYDPAVVLRGADADGRITVGVFGDSMGDGLWAGLYRQLRTDKTYEVSRFSRVSTGLTRYDYVDVQAQTVEQLAGGKVEVAVIEFGCNDAQAIAADGHVYPFKSEGWRKAYLARIDALVQVLRAQGAAVYWVGLPKMRRADRDASAVYLNELYAERARTLGVPFIATTELFQDEGGEYSAYLSEPGSDRKRLMRADDGVHMTPAGYLRLASPVATRILADVARAKAPAAGAASAVTRTAS